MPIEAEWEKAASWNEENQEKFIYPWGNSIDCSYANYWGKDGGCIGDTVEVGSYKNVKSPYGALDMAGNVSEWVADWYFYKYYETSPSSNPLGTSSGEQRCVRGGSWHFVAFIEQSTFRSSWDPSWPLNYIGFRCARDAELSSPNTPPDVSSFDDPDSIKITQIFFDGVSNSDESDEYVEIKNVGPAVIQLSGWTLTDEANHTFEFPSFKMLPGRICRIYTNEDHPKWCNFNYKQSGSPLLKNRLPFPRFTQS